jgi:NSS family neurotransmitter:Na+ symporter
MEQHSRGTWSSRLGFILAAAGSAIGLGNIWRYPYVTGQNGGAAFVLLYLACVFIIALPVLIAELSLGRKTTLNPVGAFKALSSSRFWPFVGYLGVATGVGILSFYLVIAGWTLGYIVKEITNQIGGFGAFVNDPINEIGYFAAFLALTVFVVLGGVEKGIERWSKFLMPALFLLLIGLILYNLTLEGAAAGVEFYLKPDFSKITGSTALAALGQAFFSLSLGMGTMITYGSYISKNEHIPLSATAVALFDTAIALLAGLMIFPALFSVGMEPTQGPALVFNVLPNVFSQMPGGQFIGIAFFVLLAIAALTSTVSLLEVPVAFLVDEKKWSRKKAVWVIALITFLLGLPSALSQGTVSWLSTVSFLGQTSFLDIMSFLFSDLSLPIGGFFIAVFVGWVWGVEKAYEEALLNVSPTVATLMALWGILIRYVCPLLILLVLIFKIIG